LAVLLIQNIAFETKKNIFTVHQIRRDICYSDWVLVKRIEKEKCKRFPILTHLTVHKSVIDKRKRSTFTTKVVTICLFMQTKYSIRIVCLSYSKYSKYILNFYNKLFNESNNFHLLANCSYPLSRV
jgi:hypothetical protein